MVSSTALCGLGAAVFARRGGVCLADGHIMWRNAQLVTQQSPEARSREARHTERDGDYLWPSKLGCSLGQVGFIKETGGGRTMWQEDAKSRVAW